MHDHNRGKSKSIKYRGPFVLVYREEYFTKLEAVLREKQIKNYKGGAAFKRLLNNTLDPVV